MHITDHSEGIFSFATAITASEALTQSPERSWSSRYLKWPSLRTKKAQGEAGHDIPYHHHVHRGWDHTNLRWQQVVWPKLGCNLQPLRGELVMASRMDWAERSNAEDVNMEEAYQSPDDPVR
jgi:hypothetical protein